MILRENMTWLGCVPYEATLAKQQEMVQARRMDRIQDSVLLLEHEPVYTIGRTRDQTSLLDPTALPHPWVEISRGGQATFHGPGQLVGYPILDLKQRGSDLHLYLRNLEEALMAFCAVYGVNAQRREGLTGVWVEDRKMASIGIGVRQWVSMHGFAINIAQDLSGFDSIVPCGLSGVHMTSLSLETGRSYQPEDVLEVMKDCLLNL